MSAGEFIGEERGKVDARAIVRAALVTGDSSFAAGVAHALMVEGATLLAQVKNHDETRTFILQLHETFVRSDPTKAAHVHPPHVEPREGARTN